MSIPAYMPASPCVDLLAACMDAPPNAGGPLSEPRAAVDFALPEPLLELPFFILLPAAVATNAGAADASRPCAVSRVEALASAAESVSLQPGGASTSTSRSASCTSWRQHGQSSKGPSASLTSTEISAALTKLAFCTRAVRSADRMCRPSGCLSAWHWRKKTKNDPAVALAPEAASALPSVCRVRFRRFFLVPPRHDAVSKLPASCTHSGRGSGRELRRLSQKGEASPGWKVEGTRSISPPPLLPTSSSSEVATSRLFQKALVLPTTS
mmetsp:Transcript_79947/g.158920  ORF Transcript_79947/g.158920 Transcript_79947/m.158920 type:complete len:268 (-) Transcript_79947:1187-1990(-)